MINIVKPRAKQIYEFPHDLQIIVICTDLLVFHYAKCVIGAALKNSVMIRVAFRDDVFNATQSDVM